MNLLQENRKNQLLLKALINMFDPEKEVSEEVTPVTDVPAEEAVETPVA